jgi:GINS complex subunit 4
MADLYNLLEELDERQEEDERINAKPGRVSMETAATAEMSQEWDEPEQVDVSAAFSKPNNNDAQEGDLQYDMMGGNVEDQDNALEENLEYRRLENFWVQERLHPELLNYDEDVVESFKAKIDDHQELIDQLEGSGETVDALLASIAQIDVDRTKFVLSDWLSTRLAKIEAHPLYIREKLDHMSDAEIEYLRDYGTLMEHHFRQTVLDHIQQDAFQKLDDDNMIERPTLDEFHFWRVLEEITLNRLSVGEEEDDEDTMDFQAGSTLCAKFSDMSQYLEEGKVELL